MYNLMVRLMNGFMAEAELPENFSWVTQITEAITDILWPILIVVGAAGMLYAVVLGINMARADDQGKRDEAKKRLVSCIVGLAIIIALILFFQLFINYILPALLPSIAGIETAAA